MLCGSSYKNKGVQQVLDAVVDYLPAPTDVESIKTVDADGHPIGERKCSDDEPFSALAFKVINDAYGALTFIRVYSGVLTKGASVQNSTRGKREKIGRMVEMFAKEANPVEEARAGDIIALVSLAETETGDTLCDPRPSGGAGAHALPRPGHQRLGEGQEQGANRRNSAPRSARWCAPIPRCTSKPTARPARPSCAAWASCTSKSPSTACAPSSASRASWASRRSPIARPSPRTDPGTVHPQEADRRLGPVRRGVDHVRAAGAQRRLRVRRQDRRRLGAEGVRAVGREGPEDAEGRRRARALSDRRFPRHADRRQLPRRRLQCADLRDRRQGVLSARRSARPRRSCSSR